MLIFSEKLFDQSDFNKRLSNYFSESAPCYIQYKLNMDSVEITRVNINNDDKLSINVHLNSSLSEEENIRIIIEECENKLYPKLIKEVEETIPLPPEKISTLLNKGKSLIEIMEMAEKRIVNHYFIIKRIGINNNTLVLKDTVSKETTVYNLLYITVLKYLEILMEGKYDSKSGYVYLINNSEVLKQFPQAEN